MIHLPIIQAVKITLSGKIGACLTIAAPIMLAVEMKNHVDTIITSATTIVIFIGGIIFLKKGQDRIYISMDGRMKELLETTKEIAHAKGREEVRAEVLDVSKQAARAEGKVEGIIESGAREKERVAITVADAKSDPDKITKAEIVSSDDNPVTTRPAKLPEEKESSISQK